LASPDDWTAIDGGVRVEEGDAAPQLIDDFQPYTAMATRPHWVGDLAVEGVDDESGVGFGEVEVDHGSKSFPSRYARGGAMKARLSLAVQPKSSASAARTASGITAIWP
jgi:hypothetical protein